MNSDGEHSNMQILWRGMFKENLVLFYHKFLGEPIEHVKPKRFCVAMADFFQEDELIQTNFRVQFVRMELCSTLSW